MFRLLVASPRVQETGGVGGIIGSRIGIFAENRSQKLVRHRHGEVGTS